MDIGYVEVLVKRKPPKLAAFEKALLLAVTIVVFCLVFFIGYIALVLGILLCVADYYLMMFLDVEYEYLFVENALEVDKIYKKQKRKKYLDLDMEKVLKAAWVHSVQLDEYKNQKMVVKDCTSGNEGIPYFVLIYRLGNALWEVRLEAPDKLTQAMRQVAPQKVFLN